MIDLKKCVLGIELGSTRIKAVLLDDKHMTAATGGYDWENSFIDGVWTYSPEEIITGLQCCYKSLKQDITDRYGIIPSTFGAMGISGMMHGYLPFDKDDNQLSTFRTWRNTMTAEAAEKLSALFNFNIPQRWSIAHLYQNILDGEEHAEKVARLTTLAGHIHYLLSGKNIMGVGEASGMFPVDSETCDFNKTMIGRFNKLIEGKYSWKLEEILPTVRVAGEDAGTLTEAGAALLDPEGDLKAGVRMAPPEGDAGTGMVATNSVRKRTGNVSAGTSDFAMIVLEHDIGCHKEVSMVTTPAGPAVAMVHCSNCTSDINDWVALFGEFSETMGIPADKGKLFETLFRKALEGDKDCGGLLSYNYYSGEMVTGMNKGCPVFLRRPDARMTLANFMRTHLLSAVSTLKIGMDILTEEEDVKIDKMYGHGGYFKTRGVGQRFLAAAFNSPISVMESAGEGGAYGMALLATYMLWKEDGEALEDYLDNKVYADACAETIDPDPGDVEGFRRFLDRYKKAFEVERLAADHMA